MKQTISFLISILLVACDAQAEVPLMSPDELTDNATHIVVGKVRAVYLTTHKTKEWEDTDWVAEIAVMDTEKGAGINSSDVIYAHYWNKKWIGKADPDPHSHGHGGVSKGDFVRAYLKRKDGTYHVLLPNGFATLKADEVKEAPATANLEGTWNFVYYEENGEVKEPGTRQFVIAGNDLNFRQGGETRIETTIKVRDNVLAQEFKDDQVYRSIFERVGDLLIVCGNRNKDRPSEFVCGTVNGGEFLIVLKRERS